MRALPFINIDSAKLELQEKTCALQERRTALDVAEQELQKRITEVANAEKALRRQREDQETAIRR